MRLKLYRADSVTEAMALVRTELGPEALILSTRRTSDGVELTAALEPEELPLQHPSAGRDGTAGLARREAEAATDPRRSESATADPGSLGIDFAYHGIPPELGVRLAGSDLPQALRVLLRFGPLPLEVEAGQPVRRPLLLTGAPGAGKTLSIARLATRLVLAGVNPVVITADGRRAGAAEELAAYTRLLGLSLLVAGTPAALTRALSAQAEQNGGAPVLIDTAGANPFSAGELASLADLAGACNAVPVLVMPAGLHPEEAAEQAGGFARLGVRHLLGTRLDLSRRLGSLITAALAADLALTEAGVGSGPADSLVPLTPEFLAGRLRPAAPGRPPAGAPAPAPRPPASPPMLVRPRFPGPSGAGTADLPLSQRHEADGYRK
jgi:flagellar biosynthesis protein FlhF